MKTTYKYKSPLVAFGSCGPIAVGASPSAACQRASLARLGWIVSCGQWESLMAAHLYFNKQPAVDKSRASFLVL